MNEIDRIKMDRLSDMVENLGFAIMMGATLLSTALVLLALAVGSN